MWRLLVLTACLAAASCSTTLQQPAQNGSYEKQPTERNNVCKIFREKPHWVAPAQASYQKWGIPVELMMAIIYHESSFRANARPRDKNGKLLSSAYGYSQAIDATWRQFQSETNMQRARRDKFGDAIYFIGWYSAKSVAANEELSPYDVASLYVFYHDGWSALPEDGSRDIHSQVLDVASKVYKRTLIYHRQLKDCGITTERLYTKDRNGGGFRSLKEEKNRRRNGNERWF